jgi:HTH-type transcriptional regulator, sugar sensing transcriptional regulator
MEHIEEILEDYGLDQNEVKVYLAMLIKDQTTILRIAVETGIKRSTVYLVMKRLIEKNFARMSIVGKRKSYFAVDPKKMVENIEKKKRSLEEIIPLLKEQYRSHKEKPKVIFYEGREGVEKLYEEIALNEMEKELLWFSSQQDLFEEFAGSSALLENSVTDLSKEKVRIIVNPTKTDREYAKRVNTDKKYRGRIKARVLPKHLLFVHSDNCIFENKLAIFSIKRDYFAIVIESMDIANTYRALFELAWESAEKV